MGSARVLIAAAVLIDPVSAAPGIDTEGAVVI
jgi:hypothetical protein